MSPLARRLALVLLLGSLVPLAALPPQALAQDVADDGWRQKVDDVLLQRRGAGEAVTFLVRVQGRADLQDARRQPGKAAKGAFVMDRLQQAATRSQARLVRLLEQAGVQHRPYWITNAILVQGDAALIERLARRDDVAYILADGALRAAEPADRAETPDQTRAIEWNIQQVRADDVWAMGYTGQGAVIAGQDTGYDWDHPALRATYRGWNGATADHDYHWHDAIREIDDNNIGPNPCGLDVDEPCDDDSHGTHTMGTMVGDDGGSNQIGMAPGATWIGCRNMERGWGKLSTYLECFEWFLAPTDLDGLNPDPSMAPDVINNSWSCPTVEGCMPSNFAEMEAAVEALRAAGVLVVVSAGNSGPSCSTVSTPAAIFSGSFTVGSTTSSDAISSFSSRGPVTVDGSGRMKPDLSAPGSSIRSSVPGTGYSIFSGTSMAGPHVAGLVALVLSANPDLRGDVEGIETLIEETALGLTSTQSCGGVPGSTIPNNTFGHGRIDALAAVNAALGQTGGDVTVTITPLGDPIEVPAGGGTFSYDVTLTNTGATAASVDAWVTIDGPGVTRTLGPRPVTLPAGASLTRTLTQQVPAGAPAGTYTQTLSAGTFPLADASDSFTWTKAASGSVAARGLGSTWSTNLEVLTTAETAELPTTARLERAYPNPFNPSTTVTVVLPADGPARLAVYDVLGREVAVLLDGPLPAGRHALAWDATDRTGGALPSGTYLVRFSTAGHVSTQPITLAK